MDGSGKDEEIGHGQKQKRQVKQILVQGSVKLTHCQLKTLLNVVCVVYVHMGE